MYIKKICSIPSKENISKIFKISKNYFKLFGSFRLLNHIAKLFPIILSERKELKDIFCGCRCTVINIFVIAINTMLVILE